MYNLIRTHTLIRKEHTVTIKKIVYFGKGFCFSPEILAFYFCRRSKNRILLLTNIYGKRNLNTYLRKEKRKGTCTGIGFYSITKIKDTERKTVTAVWSEVLFYPLFSFFNLFSFLKST